MKKLFFLLIICCGFYTAYSQTATSVFPGFWLSPTTWDCNCIPLPGYEITINHSVLMNTDFAYASGSIIINPTGSLIPDMPNRNLWVYGTGKLENYGSLFVANLLYESILFPLINFGNITATNLYVTTSLSNEMSGTIIVDSLYINLLLQNYGLLNSNAITNAGDFENFGTVNFTDFNNIVNFYNFFGSTTTGSNDMWNQGWVIIDSLSVITVGSLLNHNQITFDAQIFNYGRLNTLNFYNIDTISGITGAYVEVMDTSYNGGYMLGSFDFCDFTPPPSGPPYIDINTGFIDTLITWCITIDVDSHTEEQGITLFPNPAGCTLNYSIKNSLKTDIRIYDYMGKLIYEETTKGTGDIKTSGYPNGIYLFVAETEKEKLTKIFVVLH